MRSTFGDQLSKFKWKICYLEKFSSQNGLKYSKTVTGIVSLHSQYNEYLSLYDNDIQSPSFNLPKSNTSPSTQL